MPWTWGTREQDVFEGLKHAFVTAPILVMLNFEKQFILETDTSGFATGGVLSQYDNEGLLYPVTFRSQGMTSAARNYEIYDKELLAIIRGLEEWRHYLEGSVEKVQIYTDHKNLEHYRKAHDLTRRQARWTQYLSRFNFHLQHKPGPQMGKADAMSRREDHDQGEDDNRDQLVLKPEYFQIAAMEVAQSIWLPDPDLEQNIKNSVPYDAACEEARAYLRGERPGLPPRKDAADWELIDRYLLWRGKIYI